MKIRATHKTKMGISKVKKSTQIAIFQKKKKRYYKGGRVMDQKKIGAFIAEMRKARQLTQPLPSGSRFVIWWRWWENPAVKDG